MDPDAFSDGMLIWVIVVVVAVVVVTATVDEEGAKVDSGCGDGDDNSA